MPYLGLASLGTLRLAWTPLALLLYPLLSEQRGRSLGRHVITALFRMYLGSLGLTRRCSFDLDALDVLRNKPSLIIAPNHPCLLDAAMVISRLPNVACVLKADLMNTIFLGAGARRARYIRNEPVRRMVVLPRNQGKGAAVLQGLDQAAAAGFSHVLTMDSDGPHPAERIPAFMAASVRQPAAMVLGVPLFDASAPSWRVKGRRVSN